MCLGFDNFNLNTTSNVIECLPREHAVEFVTLYFKNLAWAFDSPDAYKAELLALEWAHGNNWTADHIQYTSTATSHEKLAHVYKNYDDQDQCYNFVIVEYSGAFDLAPDLIYWEKTKSSWGGFETKTEEYTTKVPHKITPADVEAINLLFQIIAFGHLANDRGINFTYPMLPNCRSPPPKPPAPTPAPTPAPNTSTPCTACTTVAKALIAEKNVLNCTEVCALAGCVPCVPVCGALCGAITTGTVDPTKVCAAAKLCPTTSSDTSISSYGDTTWTWMASAWSACSKPCDSGTQTRSVVCLSSGGAVDPTGTKCSGPKPATQQECNDIPCTGQLLMLALKNQTDNILAKVNGILTLANPNPDPQP